MKLKKNLNSWNEYLAGLIDGDGSLLISKAGYASCEITLDIYDKPLLLDIRKKLGGYVEKRSGVNAYRYRLHDKKGMMHLIQLINGHIRNSKRIPQLQRICKLYNIPFKEPTPLTTNNGWFSGFFDAEGSVSYGMKRGKEKLRFFFFPFASACCKCF
uniref:LAGLIDADG endonuclease n=1 Tax=Chaetophora sp. FACHB-2423 TaxID=2725789 RepID=A0A6H1XE25_9CHLO|nr:LAGLIDADG endonuclease [Chaetophora sp. FACHB-2423]